MVERTAVNRDVVGSSPTRGAENPVIHRMAGFFYFIGNCVAFPIKYKVLRMNRTAAEQNVSLRDPPQAENPAPQDSIFIRI